MQLSGFEPVVRDALVLDVDQTRDVDVTLDIAKQTESVTVVGRVPAVDSQSSNLSQIVTRDMLAALPVANRAASSLASLTAGVIMIDTGVGTAENYPVFTVAGGRARNQNFILDGGNASNAVGLTRPQQLTSLPVDAVQEFKVISNNYAAEYGHSTGGIVTMSTRFGTNDFAGSLFESLQHDALNARNFFAATKPPMRLNQFGGTLGGPLRFGRSFFFGSWERTRQLTSDAVVSTVPTLLNRQVDFSDVRNSAGQRVTIYDPLTRQPFAGNVIPADRIDPVARAATRSRTAPARRPTPTTTSPTVRRHSTATSSSAASTTSSI